MDKRNLLAKSNIYTKDEMIGLELEMPGVSKEQLEVVIEDDLLKITGHRSKMTEGGEYLVKEINSNDYYQEYTLDETIDTEKVKATCSNGIVSIELGLKESKKPRKIKIL